MHCGFTLKELNWGHPTQGIMLSPEAIDCQVKGPVPVVLWNTCSSCWLRVCMQETPKAVQATPSALRHPAHVDGKTRLLKTALVQDIEKRSWY